MNFTLRTLTRTVGALAAAAALQLPALLAQPGPGAGRGPDRFERMGDALGLSEVQRQQIQSIYEQQRAAVAALPGQVPGTDEASQAARRERLQAIRAETKGKVEAVLTPEQLEKLGAFRERRGDQVRRGFERMRQGFQRAAAELNLTPEQQAQVRPIFQERMEKFRRIRQDESLSPEQKREQMRALGEETKRELAAVLTPEQQTKLEAMRATAQERRALRRGPRS